MFIYYDRDTKEYTDSDTKKNNSIKRPYIEISDESFNNVLNECQESSYPCKLIVRKNALIISPDPIIFKLEGVTKTNFKKHFELKDKFIDLNGLHTKLSKLKELNLSTNSLEEKIKITTKNLEALCLKEKIMIENLI